MTKTKQDLPTSKEDTNVCGLVMPISSIDGCSEQHWMDVKSIIFESIQDAGFEPNLVSDADDVGIIQKRIIQNLYTNPIVGRSRYAAGNPQEAVEKCNLMVFS